MGIAATHHTHPFLHPLDWKGRRRHELQEARFEPLQAVAEACARLERPPLPLARPGSLPAQPVRGQQERHRAATAEGTDHRDGEPAREVEAPGSLPPTHSPRRLQVRAQPACPDPGSSTEMDEPVSGWGRYDWGRENGICNFGGVYIT